MNKSRYIHKPCNSSSDSEDFDDMFLGGTGGGIDFPLVFDDIYCLPISQSW